MQRSLGEGFLTVEVLLLISALLFLICYPMSTFITPGIQLQTPTSASTLHVNPYFLSVSISAPKYNYPFNLPTQILNAQTNRHSNNRINQDMHLLCITDVVGDVLGELCCVSLEIQAWHSGALLRYIGVHGQFFRAQCVLVESMDGSKAENMGYIACRDDFCFILLAIDAGPLTHPLAIDLIVTVELKNE